jgi:ABC-type uncharacterized transport system auxiliary subunit
MKSIALALIMGMLLAGCSLTREAPPVQGYRLGYDAVPPATSAYCSDRVLRIALIQAPARMQGTAIFYAGEQNRMYRYTRASWEQPPSDALQQIGEKSLIESGLFKAIVPYKSLAKNDWLLELRLEKMLQQIDAGGEGDTEFMMYGVLVDQYSRKVIAQKRFRYADHNDEANVQSAVDAWSREVQAFQHDLIAWLKGACDTYPKPERGDVDLR